MPKKPHNTTTIATLPTRPAVYALCGGRDRYTFVAYVGETSNLKARIYQHLVQRTTNITNGVGAVSVNPDSITSVNWWRHTMFKKDVDREAAEIIASLQLNPVMRSNNHISGEAIIRAKEEPFRTQMLALFTPERLGGTLKIRTLDDALAEIDMMKEQISKLEETVAMLTGQPRH